MVYYQENQSAYNIKKSKVIIQNWIEKQKNPAKQRKTQMRLLILKVERQVYLFMLSILHIF